MKRILLIVLAASLAVPAFGWGREGHATIAKIAEDHLTPKAKAAIRQYLNGSTLMEWASYADDYKSSTPFDKGFDPTDGTKRIEAYPHTFESNMQFEPFRGWNDNGRYVKNCIETVCRFGEDLKNAKTMDEKQRWLEIVLVTHFIGDMHCPDHIRYNPEEMTIGYFNVIYKGEPFRYHTYWDSECIKNKMPFSITDIAAIVDICNDKEIAEIVKGDPYDWGRSSAEISWPIHSIKPGDKLTSKFILKTLPITKTQLRNAGYRLAHFLNRTFDPGYARRGATPKAL